MKVYKALSIAGSDPSGGAGIQADLKTFSSLGVYGATVITAVVDENTVSVTDVHPVPVLFVQGQIRSVLDDVGADAIKIGMLHSSELILAVKETLSAYSIINSLLLQQSFHPLFFLQQTDFSFMIKLDYRRRMNYENTYSYSN